MQKWIVTNKETDQRGIIEASLERATELEAKGHTVTALPTTSQEKDLRRWSAAGIGTD